MRYNIPGIGGIDQLDVPLHDVQLPQTVGSNHHLVVGIFNVNDGAIAWLIA